MSMRQSILIGFNAHDTPPPTETGFLPPHAAPGPHALAGADGCPPRTVPVAVLPLRNRGARAAVAAARAHRRHSRDRGARALAERAHRLAGGTSSRSGGFRLAAGAR